MTDRTGSTGIIDSHAHVWDRSCTLVPGARYHPDYEATIGTYLACLDAHGIERAVLVQPSFLGSDNTYLLGCLAAHADRLHGIVVVDPSISDAEIEDMTATGVIGLRYNLLSLDPTALKTNEYQQLTRRVTARDWWVEVQAKGVDWPAVDASLGDARVMVDHFGKPSDPECAGLSAILRRDPQRTTIKLSAPYRQSLPDMSGIAAQLISRFGAERCLWGSDWPWTQHETAHTYADTLEWLGTWTTPAHRKKMVRGAEKILKFSALS